MAEIKPQQGSAPLREEELWKQLRRLTPARIGLGRVGSSLPTAALLDFELAHARARDAVHAGFDADRMIRELREIGFSQPQRVSSMARDAGEYLLRPDLGRKLEEQSRRRLQEYRETSGPCALAIVIADGLSAAAPARHAPYLLQEFRRQQALSAPGNTVVVVGDRARVALGDVIGEILQAEVVLVLIGERPGLSSPDSLGAYLTWAPRAGCTDADRNCVSNIRPGGLPCAEAARRLAWLLAASRRLQCSGVALKDDSEDAGPLLS